MTSQRRDNTKGKHEMSRNYATHKTQIVVLKTIIDDAMNDKTIVDDNAKRIRAKLRVALASSHIRNTSWIANNQREYDAIRCAFDARYNERMIASRKRKTRAKSNDDANATTNNANENA